MDASLRQSAGRQRADHSLTPAQAGMKQRASHNTDVPRSPGLWKEGQQGCWPSPHPRAMQDTLRRLPGDFT